MARHPWVKSRTAPGTGRKEAMSEHGINRRRLLTSAAAVGGLTLGMAAGARAASAEARDAARARAASRAGRAAETWENLIEKSSFSSWTNFTKEWNLLYPWDGDPDTHNGAALMQASQVSLSGGVLTLTATRLSAPAGESAHAPHAPLWYRSGAIHAKEQIVVDDEFPEYDIEGEFRTQTGLGVWPAFWTTGTEPNWPPESDILEYVGDSTNLFNTWNKTSSGDPGETQDGDAFVTRAPVPVADPYQAFRKYRVWLYKDGPDVMCDYYLGTTGGQLEWVATHRGKGWAGVPQYLIINLQMGSWASDLDGPDDEDWPAQPGPAGDTYFHARNVWMGRTRIS
ncbi:glycosyl hydrolase family 16 [Nonomuraea fuscirosea]|uniref:Glycosyl hydrolase family 16 n=2 Tax=Nonomuraea fuscirosea TaxID=1291556 RepID=A0A2T0N5M3_9ACTN|nr:glycosyl hydrolase family 16 [Nonomuraea fuscirosea]